MADPPNPIFLAMEEGEPVEVIRSIVEGNPGLLRQRNDEGYLPVHYAFEGIGDFEKEVALYLLGAWPESTREKTDDDEELLPAHLVCMHSGDLTQEEDDEAALVAVRTVVEAYPDALRETDKKGRLPLHLAFRFEHPPLAVTRYLVEHHRPALQAMDNDGWVPFHYAVRVNLRSTLPNINYMATEWLGSVFAKTNDGKTPLFLAVQEDTTLDVVEFLFERNPNAIREKDDLGRTPLHEAARMGWATDVARFFLRQWPDAAKQPSHDGRLPLHEAARAGSVDMSQLLVEHYPEALEQPCHKGRIPLHEAALMVRLNAVRYLVRQRIESARATTNKGWLPIHLALTNRPWNDWGQKQVLYVARFLVRTFPESLWKATSDQYAYLPLHIAAGHGGRVGGEIEDKAGEINDYVEYRLRMAPRFVLRLVRLLVTQAPMTVGTMSGEGMLPVHYAISRGFSLQAVQYLFENWQGRPESVQYRAVDGRSALHLAIGREIPSVEHVQFLVQWRPHLLQVCDRQGFTPMHFAVAYETSYQVWQYLIQQRPRYLQQRSNDGSLPLHLYLAHRTPKLMGVRLLVNYYPGALEEPDNHSSLPLHIAVSRSETPLEIVEYLVERRPGALDAVDGDGCLALHVAVSRPVSIRNASTDTEKLLVTVKSLVETQPRSVHRRNGSGFLPLHVAAEKDAPLDVLYYLVRRDPDLLSVKHSRPHKRPKLH